MNDKDLEHLNDQKGGQSNCCGAGTYGDNMICEDCKEPCIDENEIECQFCGRIKRCSPTPDGDEICPSCWNVIN